MADNDAGHLQEMLKKAEETIAGLKQTVGNLQEEISFLQGKVDRMSGMQDFLEEVFYRAALDGLLLELSPSIYKVSGYLPEELVGTNVLDYYENPTEREAYIQALHQQGEVRDFPIALRAKDGRPIKFSMNSRLVMREGEAPCIEGAMTDQTERFMLLEALRTARDDALVASKAKSDFLAVMSHELRTPIHGLMGMQALMREEPLSPSQREYLAAAEYSVKALHGLVNNILDLSKVEAGMVELSPEMFELYDTMQEILAPWVYQAREKGLHLWCEFYEVPKRITMDKARLRQVLINLVGNAVKFTEKGFVRVVVTTDDEKQAIHFEVEDSGIGLSQEDLMVIFEPFTQADSSTTRNYQGTGLGTTIAQRLVSLMGGEIQAQSQLGHGSCFSFSLPMIWAGGLLSNCTLHLQNLTEPPVVASEQLSVQPMGVGGLRVLLADDDVIGLKIVCKALVRAGFEVTTVADGLTALSLAKEGEYDVLLLDIQMPGLDGASVTEQFRAFEKESGREPIPIIGLSAHAMDEIERQCHQVGMNAFISKPVAMRDVLEVLQKASCQKEINP